MKYCKNCGTELNDNDLYCPKCGKKFEEDIKTNTNDNLNNNQSFNGEKNASNSVDEKYTLCLILGILGTILSVSGLSIAGIPLGITTICLSKNSHESAPKILGWVSIGVSILYTIGFIIYLIIYFTIIVTQFH